MALVVMLFSVVMAFWEMPPKVLHAEVLACLECTVRWFSKDYSLNK